MTRDPSEKGRDDFFCRGTRSIRLGNEEDVDNIRVRDIASTRTTPEFVLIGRFEIETGKPVGQERLKFFRELN